MAVFKDSRNFASVSPSMSANEEAQMAMHDRSIGDIIRQTKNLSVEAVEQILTHQRQHGLRFGEAAVALGFVTNDDVLFALAQQFHYPYASSAKLAELNPELVTATKPFVAQSEAFRHIRSQLLARLFQDSQQKFALAITSPDQGDGKSFFCANLAIVFSQLGGRTLLVDANMRDPRQHLLFGLENTLGLSGILSGRAAKNVIRPVGYLPSLFVLPVGNVPPNPLELIERPAFGLLMRELIAKFDYVIVDTPAASHGADATAIASRCGAALILARQGASHLRPLQRLTQTLQESPLTLAGVIMNEF